MAKTAPTHDEDLRIALVELDKIQLLPEDTDRILEDPAAISSLAATIRAVGVLQPIGLGSISGAGKACYRPIWGRRRIAAAREAGLREIPARVKTFASEAELVAAREIENLHRLELNPIEEAEAVAKLSDLAIDAMAKAGDLVGLDDRGREYAVVERVAQQLGKATTWVRDRSFLARLEGESRSEVLSGRLPLSHAREIAKVQDPEERDRLAQLAAAPTADERPMDLADLREQVARQLYALTFAPWKLEVPFGEFPACTTCPHNSANRPGLFEHHERFAKTEQEAKSNSRFIRTKGTKAPEVGVCTNKGCFDRKATATKRAVNTAAGRVAKATEQAGLKQTSAKIAEPHVPGHVEQKVVLTVARQKLERQAGKAESGSKVRASAPAKAPAKDGPNTRAVAAWKVANDALEVRARDAVRAMVLKDGMCVVGVIAAQLLSGGPGWLFPNHWDERQATQSVKDIRTAEKEAQSTAMNQFLKVLVGGATEEAASILQAAAGKPAKGKRDPMDNDLYAHGPRMPAPAAAAMLALLGIDAGYRSIDSFLSAELDKAKAGADAKPAKQKGAKKAGKKASRKKASKGRAA